MSTEDWIMQAKLAGEFFISDERRESALPLVEGLRTLSITPQFDDEGKWTGLHELEATISLESPAVGRIDSNVAFGRAKHLAESVCDLASLSIGRPVRVDGGVSVKHRLADSPPQYRLITGVTEAANFGPPAPLVADVLAVDLEPKLHRVIRWWSRGIASVDPVDRLLALSGALDLLAGTVEGPPNQVRKCKKCGHEQTIGPGLRQRVVHFLTCELHYDESDAKAMYESRIDIAHAKTDLREDDLRRYRGQADMLATAVRNGLATRMGVQLPPVPESLPVDIHTALLDIVYTEGDPSK